MREEESAQAGVSSSPMGVSSAASPASGEGEASVSSSSGQQASPVHVAPPGPPPPLATTKKKRNLPGNPDPDAEVIALSPKTLLATNRFVCEICNKGFQRDQNLQLHRRGHNLPWKLRQRTGKERRKRVYVCPEASCVHHHPSRALGDLTGIKKHFCRKHGEKKWKCDKCSKKYAVQSDWKAHSKTCGSREYRCDCGTLFSRRDSFITHRAFCDALALESAKVKPAATPPPPPPPQEEEEDPDQKQAAVAVAASDDGAAAAASSPPASTSVTLASTSVTLAPMQQHPDPKEDDRINPSPRVDDFERSVATTTGSCSSGVSSSILSSLLVSTACSLEPPSTSALSDLLGAMSGTERAMSAATPTEPTPLSLSSNASHVLHNFFSQISQDRRPYPPPPPAHMSATALLQKAAQMGAAASSSGSFLRSLGVSTSSSADMESPSSASQANFVPPPVGLRLGLQYDSSFGMPELMVTELPLLSSKPTTLDLLGLGLGMGPDPGSAGGLSALITSISGAGHFGGGHSAAKHPWDGAADS